jgi:uncharacterized protein YjbI with pentapeptide repeats
MRPCNYTGFPFGTKLALRTPPQREVAVIVRARFRLRPGEPLVALGSTEQGAMTADRFAEGDDERAGECLYPSDFAETKRGTEVMLLGTCHAPGGRTVVECPVRFTVGAWSKSLLVFGRRTWVERGRSAVPSEPQGFVRMPLRYANAFGGPGFPANPVGKGFAGDELPNVESPAARIRARSDSPLPASFGPINPAWWPRAAKVGKAYGEAWRKTRAPFYSEDFDPSYFQAAPIDQQLLEPLRGDERVGFENLHPAAARFSTQLPSLRIRAFLRTTLPDAFETPMALDTLVADLDEETLTLTWRGHAPVREDDLTDVKTVLLAPEPMDEAPKTFSHYMGLVEAFEADPFGREKLTPPEVKARRASAQAAKGGSSSPADVVADAMNNATASRGAEAKAAGDSVVAQMRDGLARLDALKAANANAAPATPTTSAGGVAEQMAAALARLKDLRANAGAEGPQPADAAKFDALLANPALARRVQPPKVEPGPGRDLSGRDFNGRDLRGRDLSGANLRGAHMAKAKLEGANLAGANLREAVLAEASLEGADLKGADLTKTVLSEADLRRADLSKALLDYTVFSKADLSGATLTGGRGQHTIFLEAKLPKAQAQSLQLTQAMFIRVDLDDADLRFSRIVQCMFFEARARRASFSGATLHSSSFAKSDLSDADLVEIQGERTVWRGATLDRADLRWSQLLYANFDEAVVRWAKLSAANLRGADFYRAMLDDTDLVRANLFGANLGKARLTRTSFLGANLYEAKLRGAGGADTVFTQANLKRAVFDST